MSGAKKERFQLDRVLPVVDGVEQMLPPTDEERQRLEKIYKAEVDKNKTAEFAIETITPEMALKAYMKGTNPRQLRVRSVIEYALAMRDGKWKIGPPLSFTADGAGVDCFHRCLACWRANMMIPFAVQRGVLLSAKSVFDDDAHRSGGDIYQEAYKLPARMAGFLSAVMTIVALGPVCKRVLNIYRLGFRAENPDVWQFIRQSFPECNSTTSHLFKAPFMGALGRAYKFLPDHRADLMRIGQAFYSGEYDVFGKEMQQTFSGAATKITKYFAKGSGGGGSYKRGLYYTAASCIIALLGRKKVTGDSPYWPRVAVDPFSETMAQATAERICELREGSNEQPYLKAAAKHGKKKK
jgi:hypothetical protein